MEATTIRRGYFIYRTFTTTNVSKYIIDFIEIDIEDYLKLLYPSYTATLFLNNMIYHVDFF